MERQYREARKRVFDALGQIENQRDRTKSNIASSQGLPVVPFSLERAEYSGRSALEG